MTNGVETGADPSHITPFGLLCGVAWMSALLASAVGVEAEITPREEAGIATLPYLAWEATVGPYFPDQLQHLL